MIAFYHAGAENGVLGRRHTVPIGDPWLPGSACDHMLLLEPFLFPELERCDDARGHVQVLWLLPITEAERDFKIAHGADALIERFETADLEYWLPERKSVV